MSGLERAHGPQRAHLGHAPCVQRLHIVAVLEAAHHGGQAEPPTTVRRNVVNLPLVASTCANKPCQTVGTPAASVTSSLSIRSCSDLPSSHGPGNTSLAPTIQAT